MTLSGIAKEWLYPGVPVAAYPQENAPENSVKTRRKSVIGQNAVHQVASNQSIVYISHILTNSVSVMSRSVRDIFSNTTKGAAAAAMILGSVVSPFSAAADDDEAEIHSGVTASSVVATNSQNHTSYDMMNALDEYAQTSTGMGIFINMQHDMTPEQGVGIGNRIVEALNRLELNGRFELNQSRGTTTDFTFYVGEAYYTVNARNMKSEFPKVVQRLQESNSLKLASFEAPENSR